MSSTQYSPTVPAESVHSDSEQSILSITASSSIQKGKKKAVDYNSKDFTLEPDSESLIYIFRNGLFTRSLLPIIKNQDRQILVKCTL